MKEESKKRISSDEEVFGIRQRKMLFAIEMAHYDHGRNQPIQSLYHDFAMVILELTNARAVFLGYCEDDTHVRLTNLATFQKGFSYPVPWGFLDHKVRISKDIPLFWEPCRERKNFYQRKGIEIEPFETWGGPLMGIPLVSGSGAVGVVVLIGEAPLIEDLGPLWGTLAHFMWSHKMHVYKEKAEAQVRYEQSLKNTFFDHSPTKTLMMDQNLTSLLANRSWEEFYGVKDLSPESKGKFLMDMANHAWVKIFNKGRDGIAQTGEDDLIILPNGEKRWIHWRLVPWYGDSGEQEGLIFFTQDCTQKKILRTELEETVKGLRASNVELDAYIHMCAHDLKEPLRSMSVFADLLLREHMTLSDQEKHNYLHRVVDGAQRMHHLIESVLRYSQVNRGEIERTAINIKDLISDILQDLGALLEERQARVTYDGEIWVEGVFVEIRQLFQNIIINGIKFNQTAHPQVDIRAWIGEDERVHFDIQDNGIGIEEEYRHRIFKMFCRLESRSEYPGSGIGLAICRKVVEGHGGVISVTSCKSKGSTFHFTLPRYSYPR